MSSHDTGLFVAVDSLVDRWCECRSLGLLRIILQAYPLASSLSDEWHELYKALRLIRSQYGKQLLEEEANLLGEAIVSVDQRLYPT